jgi:hypothetical protein
LEGSHERQGIGVTEDTPETGDFRT